MESIVRNVDLMLERRGYAKRAYDDDVTRRSIASPSLKKAPATKYPHADIRHATSYVEPRADGDATPEIVVAYFVVGAKISIDVIKNVVLKVSDAVRRIVLVYDKCLTPDAKSAVAINRIFVFELFSFDQMSYDLVEALNYRVSKFDKSTETLFAEWHKLPVILASDPICRYFGFRSGDVVRVDDDEETTLRRCV